MAAHKHEDIIIAKAEELEVGKVYMSNNFGEFTITKFDGWVKYEA